MLFRSSAGEAPVSYTHLDVYKRQLVSVAMRTEFPKLKIIDRSQLNSNDEVPGNPMDKVALFEREVKEARSVGADVAIAGNFAGYRAGSVSH